MLVSVLVSVLGLGLGLGLVLRLGLVLVLRLERVTEVGCKYVPTERTLTHQLHTS